MTTPLSTYGARIPMIILGGSPPRDRGESLATETEEDLRRPSRPDGLDERMPAAYAPRPKWQPTLAAIPQEDEEEISDELVEQLRVLAEQIRMDKMRMYEEKAKNRMLWRVKNG